MISLEVAAKATSAAAAIPVRVRGRQSSAQKVASIRYQGAQTVLSAISITATGISTTAAPSIARSHTVRTCPALAWKMKTPQPDAMRAPHTANSRDACASGSYCVN